MDQMEILARYESEYQRFNNMSVGRTREGQNLLRQLSDHAGKPIHECDGNDIRAFLAHLTDQDFKITTIAKKLGLIRPFFKWLWEVGELDAETWMRIQSIRPPRGSNTPQLPRPYSKKELGRFRRELDQRWPRVSALRWRRWRNGTTHFRKVQPEIMRIQIEAIVALALHCGLRRHEIFEIEIEDMHFDNAYVVVREGKGGKFREVPHTEVSRAAVKAWLEMRQELFRRARIKKHDRPWLSLAWWQVALRPMSEERFATLLATIGDWELHRFRHTCATAWLRSIKRLEIVQRLLGHARIHQTLTYAQLVNDDVLAEVAKHESAFSEAVA